MDDEDPMKKQCLFAVDCAVEQVKHQCGRNKHPHSDDFGAKGINKLQK